MTAHISAKKGQIAKTVIMPGDPLRTKYIVENYLENYELVSSVRNNYIYTGFYKGVRVSVATSGIGMPSMGIYSYELFKFYDVENIIRIGTCGSNRKDIKIFDIVLADNCYTLSTIANLFDDYDKNEVEASKIINKVIKDNAEKSNIEVKEGKVVTSDIFDIYADYEKYSKHFPKDLNALATEMEGFILLFMAKMLNKNAACLLTVVDSRYEDVEVSSEEREKSLYKMIELSLDSAIML